ncbi:MAG: DUF167 domain-containing protein [Desulfobacterales bacterium]
MAKPVHAIPFLTEHSDGMVLKVYVQPRSSKNMIAGRHEDALKVKLTAPPVSGAANKMCIDYMAKCLKMPKSCISLLSGEASRHKRILIACKDAATRSKILKYFEGLS